MLTGVMHGVQGQQVSSNGHAGVARDDAKTVFVRNVSFQASESEIRDFFSQAGKVTEVRRQTDDQGQPLLVSLVLWVLL